MEEEMEKGRRVERRRRREKYSYICGVFSKPPSHGKISSLHSHFS